MLRRVVEHHPTPQQLERVAQELPFVGTEAALERRQPVAREPQVAEAVVDGVVGGDEPGAVLGQPGDRCMFTERPVDGVWIVDGCRGEQIGQHLSRVPHCRCRLADDNDVGRGHGFDSRAESGDRRRGWRPPRSN